MADKLPLKVSDSDGYTPTRFQTGDTVGVANGGTGATTQSGARTNLGLAIGSDVQAWDADLDAIAALASTGIAVRIAANTWAQRTIVGTAGRITVADGNGVAGNPTIDLDTLSDGGTGTFLKFTRDAYGRVSGTTAVVAGDITGLVDATYVNVSGDTMTGFLTLNADPTSSLHAATKQYVDNTAQGLRQKPTARATTTAALPANTYNNGASGVGATLTGNSNGALAAQDGVTLVAGDYLLVRNEATAANNGLYVLTQVGSGGAPYILTRAPEMDVATEFSGAFIPVDNEGTTYKNTLWLNNYTASFVVGTTAVTFTQLNSATSYTAGNGIDISANVISAKLAARLTFVSTNIDLASSGVTPGTYTKVTVDTYGRVTVGATATPADIGAQPADATLTVLAAYNTNGLLTQTAADTFTGRTITGTAGRIVATNGDGVAGNPTLDLDNSGVTPGTYNSVTVDTYGRVTAGTTAASSNLTKNYTNGEAGSIAIGRAVYISGAGQVKLANANSGTTYKAVALVGATSISSGVAGSVAYAGVLVATTTQWDAVTGQTGGLTSGATYYVSNTTAGALTTTAPTSGYVVPVGVAASTTDMILNFQTPIQL